MGKTVTASSMESNNFRPDYAFDSSSHTSWKAAKNEKSGWLMVDLGKPISIGSIAISEVVGHTEKNISHFKLEYKKGNNWLTIEKGEKIGEVFQTSFKPITAQHFRLNILDAETEPQIKDMQLYYDE
jgi:alpha-L-fucosidase